MRAVDDCRGTGATRDLLSAAGAIEAYLDRKLASAGLTLSKLAALDWLMQAGGTLPLGQLAEKLACVKSNVTQLVDRLDADGLVSRESDPTDRRSRLAVITEAGRSAHERGTRLQQEAERDLFDTLTPEDAARLSEISRKLRLVAAR